MADAEAARGAAEAAIGDQRDLVAHTLPIQRRRGAEHLAHARTALGPFIADDQHIAFLVLALVDAFEAFFFVVENARRADEAQILKAGHLHDGAIGSQIALQRNHAAGDGDRTAGLADDVLIFVELHLGQVLGHRPAGDGHHVAMQEAAVQQRLHHERNSAGFEQVLGDIPATRLEVADVRRLLEDFAHIEQVEINASLVRHGRQMQRRVGRTAGGGHRHGGILESLAGDDVARADFRGQQLHHLLARCGAERVTDFIGRRRAAAIGQRQADGFSHHRHGVGGVLAAARTG